MAKTKRQELDVVLRHVYSEPRFVAWTRWHHDHPSVAAQLFAGVPRREVEDFVDGKVWANPDRVVSAVVPEAEPDWDWWEPRYDQPWRRQAARDRVLDARLAS